MKESVLDVLMYMFEHYFDEDAELEADRENLQHALLSPFPDSILVDPQQFRRFRHRHVSFAIDHVLTLHE